MPDNTPGEKPKFGRFICPNCAAINVEPGNCLKCGADLETGESTGDAQNLRAMEGGAGPNKRTLILGGMGALLVLSAIMMMTGSHHEPAQAPQSPAAQTPASTSTGADGEPVGDLAKAVKIATQYAAFKATPPAGYTYKDTSADTPGQPSFGIESEARNQKILFLVWDNTAPVDHLELVLGKVPFSDLGVALEHLNDIKVEDGSRIIGSGSFPFFVGRFPAPEGKVKMALVGAYNSPIPGKAIVVVARPFDDSDKLDYQSTLWLVDDMAAAYTAAANKSSESSKETAATQTGSESAPLATPEDLEAYRKSIEELLKTRFTVSKKDAADARSSVVIGIDPNGKLNKLEVTQTSGNDMVDKEVLRAIQSSQPYSQPPHTSTGSVQLKVTTDGASLAVARN